MSRRLQVVYEPKGRAAEYAPLAANLYDGCPHACSYCYVPGILRRHRLDFHEAAMPRRDVLAKLQADCRKLAVAIDWKDFLARARAALENERVTFKHDLLKAAGETP